MPHQEEAPGKTQDTLKRLCLSAGLGTPWCPSRRAGGSVWGEGGLRYWFLEPAIYILFCCCVCICLCICVCVYVYVSVMRIPSHHSFSLSQII
ncbi:hypothetical protein QTP70_002464 [Hemibagrus guttatus]|uniref:Uncharacterized protein n=1 Tax=Hemibagrus guttatus TaxID=175788 RepID=A0AAE0QK68_9TELE|nr:hypothetical protein QTP70_002464 [Hemibagrus guttatus]